MENTPTVDNPPKQMAEEKISTPHKRKKRLIIGVILFVLFGVVVIHQLHKRPSSSVTKNQEQNTKTNETPSNTNTSAASFDCLGNTSCPELTVQGDPYATSPNGQPAGFHGYADPSLRKDPMSNRLWLSYSYAKVAVVDNRPTIPAVDIHLAYSDDGGKTWQYQGPLWPATPDTNKGGNGSSGYSSNEVSNILPAQNGNSVTWYGIRSSYFHPLQGERPTSSWRLILSQASTPQGLATGKSVVLGSAQTASVWGVTTNLSSSSPEVSNCDLLTEPSLYYEKNTLYLVSNCILFNKTSAKINASASNTVVFATDPTGDMQSWKWRYVGILFHGSDATQLDLSGVEGFTQGDIVKAKNGDLLLIGSLDSATTPPNNLNHFGCFVFSVKSIDPPSLATDASGKLIILASVTATDLGAAGPGSCTYDPNSTTGILIARRHLTSKPATSSVNITGIKP